LVNHSVEKTALPGDADSRTRILIAARTEFAEFGYAGARVARIARRASVNKQLLYYYFGSKVGLHEAASVPTDVSPPGRGIGAAPERFRRSVDRLFTELQAQPEVVALLVDRQRSVGAEATARGFAASAIQDLAAAISEGQGMGYFGDRVDPAEVAGKALVLCAGYLALETILPDAARTRARWSAEVSALLLKRIAW
jgi:AcrR family transcriptional regulator